MRLKILLRIALNSKIPRGAVWCRGEDATRRHFILFIKQIEGNHFTRQMVHREKFTPVRTIVLLLWALVTPNDSIAATERRCGWLENPTPANWWLTDSTAEWVLSTQGGTQASGMDLIPDLATRQFVTTNGHYGYACACVNGEYDSDEKRVTRIISVEQLPLAKCRRDPKLPKH
jgi:hypothetical protein